MVQFLNWGEGITPRGYAPVTMVWPYYQNDPGNAGKTLPADYIHGKSAQKSKRTRWRDYISDLGTSRFGVEPAELSEIAENHGVIQVLELLPPRPS